MKHSDKLFTNSLLCQVTGKINSITLDSCKKVGLVYGDVVSTVDIVNCQSVQVNAYYLRDYVNVSIINRALVNRTIYSCVKVYLYSIGHFVRLSVRSSVKINSRR